MPEDVQGLNALGKLLDDLPERIQAKVMQSAVRVGAAELVGPLRSAAPVFTGRLEESVSIKTEGVGSRVAKSRARNAGALLVSAGIIFKGAGARYWHFSEFGTVKQPARPWIRPTFARLEKQVLEAMKAYAGKRIEREAKKLGKEQGNG